MEVSYSEGRKKGATHLRGEDELGAPFSMISVASCSEMANGPDKQRYALVHNGTAAIPDYGRGRELHLEWVEKMDCILYLSPTKCLWPGSGRASR
jgi:hypothetical protein